MSTKKLDESALAKIKSYIRIGLPLHIVRQKSLKLGINLDTLGPDILKTAPPRAPPRPALSKIDLAPTIPGGPSKLALPTKRQWEMFLTGFSEAGAPVCIRSISDLAASISKARSFSAKTDLEGITHMLEQYPDTKETFFQKTLPFIVLKALALPQLLCQPRNILYNGAPISLSDPFDGPLIPLLVPGGSTSLMLDRSVCTALLAHIFLGTLPKTNARSHGLNCNSCLKLLMADLKPEIAKLRMITHYFERCIMNAPTGHLKIYRVGVPPAALTTWLARVEPLAALKMMPEMAGFESDYGRSCMHADFANEIIGGGVLSGGCVQEEIRFAICPELILACLFCPRMLQNEAIHVIGGEQFSKYSGFAYSLRYAGDHRDMSPREKDGTVLNAITAIDALDGRGYGRHFKNQWRADMLARELNKAYAGFYKESNDEGMQCFKEIATGNWGCGAFKGHVCLKAILQWASASAAGRPLRYFGYSEKDFISSFGVFVQNLLQISPPLTVGALVRAVIPVAANQEQLISAGKEPLRNGVFFGMIQSQLILNHNRNTTEPSGRHGMS